MEQNNQNPNTGSKGVFPGVNIHQGAVEALINQPQFAGEAEVIPENTKTYIRLETKNTEGQVSGIIELDLISFREKGQESRYLSVNVVGSNKEGNQSDTIMSIGNEEDFKNFKKFISELNWND